MPFQAGNIADLLAGEAYKQGVIGKWPLQSIIEAARAVQPAADCPNPRTIIVSNAIDVAQVALTGSGRLYRVRIENLSSTAIFALVSDSVNAQIIAAGVCNVRVSATVAACCEAAMFADPVGPGVPFGTSLRVRAFQLDGTGTTAANSGVTVKLLVGP